MRKKFLTVAWAKTANIYEVNIRQYTVEGTFMAFSNHLPRLRAMGVDILWLMPITPISEKERLGSLGSYYACSSYMRVSPEFGNLNDFKHLVREAHLLGFKVIIDWVANHTGWDHEWTVVHPEWYVKDAQGGFTERNGWKDVIDLDYTNSAMREAMIEAMKYWVDECNIDGFRCDMAHLVTLDFWKEARTACDAIKPLFWLAECEETSYHDVFDVSYAWSWMHTTGKQANGEASLHDVREVLHAYTQYPEGARKLFFTTNHDENSWNGTEYEKYGKAAKAWAVFTATWERGMPLIYSGQESPNTKRIAFFHKDLFEWKYPLQLEDFYRELLHLHKTNPAVQEGETFILPSAYDDQLMVFLRRRNEAMVLVLLNISNQDRLQVSVQHEWLTGKFRNIFTGLEFYFNGSESFELQSGEYFVYEKMT
ncbi:MAG: 1,4-alpha-glucan branching protein [Bacteroidetes bacterium]|nr:1,4-alpha-glucan branching protein [Bacteroidota bacterium]